MGLSPIWLVNRDPTETASIIASPPFAKYDLRPLERIEQWTDEEAARVACGVGAIPSIAPQSEGEKLVYALAERIFSSTKKLAGGPRPFMEMAYKPHVTLMYSIAQRHGWRPIGGEFWPVLVLSMEFLKGSLQLTARYSLQESKP
jgi:quinate dehydrogenase